MRWKFLDEITKTDEKNYINGTIQFPINDEWHQDHFPQSPIIPGVLLIEVVANLAGKLILLRTLHDSLEWVAPILLKTGECRFKDITRPGDLIEAEVIIEKYDRRLVISKGTLRVDGKERARVSVTSARIPVTTVGDPHVLVPWQIQEIIKIYPSISSHLKERFELMLTQLESKENVTA